LRFDEYRKHDAIGLAGLVAKREVTPGELLDTALARLDTVNGTLNAVINDLREQARGAVAGALPRGPLHGVPFLIKDIGLAMKGVRTCAGSRIFKHAAPAEFDSALISAYREAGLVLFGKTNTPEFGMAATTEPVAFGITRNPWDPARTPGGSSGGSAAAVAAGIVPAAHASDGGGSIRIPASCCGLFGMKPSRGRVSASPLGDSWGGFSINHALTRSVRDSALLLDLSCKPAPGDPYFLSPPETPFVREVGRDPGKLRIGFIPGGLAGTAIDAPVASALHSAAEKCEALGHSVEECAFPEFPPIAEKANAIIMASVALMLKRAGDQRGRPIEPSELESVPRIALETGGAIGAIEVMDAFAAVYNFGLAVARLFDSYDVLLTSTLGRLPVPVGELSIAQVNRETYGAALYRFIPNTRPFNICGAPAMSVPLEVSEEGSPIGIQFAAPQGAEGLLFRLAGQLEAAHAWFDRVPEDARWAIMH
jgi:amidase